MSRRLAPLALLAAAVLAFAWRGGATPAPATGPSILRVEVREVLRPFETDDGAREVLDRRLEIEGDGFFGTSFGPFVHLIGPDGAAHEARMVVLESGRLVTAWPPAGLRGPFTLVVRNPDGHEAHHAVGL